MSQYMTNTNAYTNNFGFDSYAVFPTYSNASDLNDVNCVDYSELASGNDRFSGTQVADTGCYVVS